MRVKEIVLPLGMAGLLLAAAQVNATIVVRLEPAVAEVQLGESFVLDLVADFGPHKVLGWGLDLAHDPVLVDQLGSPVIGPLWRPLFTPDGDGLAGLSMAGSTHGDGVLLASVTYQALSVGQTQIQPSRTVSDLNEGFPLDPTGFGDVVFEAAVVTVTPEPHACLFVLVGGLIGSRVRLRR